MDEFSYLDYQLNGQTIKFNFKLTNAGTTHLLTESMNFPVALNQAKLVPLLKALHLALGISYYKIFLSQTIRHPYQMGALEADFWNKVFQNGLGEFLYVNNLKTSQIASFTAQGGTPSPVIQHNLVGETMLGLGGGKDSIVSGELLKSVGVTTEGFVMATGEQLGQTKAVAEVMGIKLNAVKRQLDPQLLKLQEMPGAYKGHVPISLIFGLVGAVLALSTGKKYVVVGNESSASTPTIKGKNGDVNHQWSKSFAFEQSLQSYLKQYVCPDLIYFSAIRPLSSVAVAKRFAQLPKYFEVFTSDNYVFRIDPRKRPNGRWSLESPKSLSSFILLSPWLSEAEMLRIFGRNFMSQAKLEKLFLELTGAKGLPPLDCVGTVDELVLSLNLSQQQNKWQDSVLLKVARQAGVIKDHNWLNELDQHLRLSPDQAFPSDLKKLLLEELEK